MIRARRRTRRQQALKRRRLVSRTSRTSRRPRRVEIPATLAVNVTETVGQILWDGRTFHLRKPVDLRVRRKGPYYFIGYQPLAIEGYGRDRQKALESFADVFAATWDSIVPAKARHLGKDAQELQRRLRDLVARVETGKPRLKHKAPSQSHVEPAA